MATSLSFRSPDSETVAMDVRTAPFRRYGLNVTFTITAGGGGIGNATNVTDPDGIATGGVWTLGPTAGVTNELTAAVEGANPVVFTAQASP